MIFATVHEAFLDELEKIGFAQKVRMVGARVNAPVAKAMAPSTPKPAVPRMGPAAMPKGVKPAAPPKVSSRAAGVANAQKNAAPPLTT